ncbi:MAG TPA: hypothetical protein VGF86_06670 [Candidatus Tumulicola sp.]
MKGLRLAYQGLRIWALLAFVAGCGSGTPSQLTPLSQRAPAASALMHPATNPQRVIDLLASRPEGRVAGDSRMSDTAKTSALLYVSDTEATTLNVYSASTWNPLGELFGFVEPYGMCVDGAQDVYVTDLSQKLVREYAHGAIAPTRTLADHQGNPLACAVGPKTGDLAISNFIGTSSAAGNVIVYQAAKGTPTEHSIAGFSNCFLLGYDGNDNLYVDGRGATGTVLLAQLPKGKSAFRAISMNESLGFPGGVAWDGEFLAVADQEINTIYQFKISTSGTTPPAGPRSKRLPASTDPKAWPSACSDFERRQGDLARERYSHGLVESQASLKICYSTS